MRDITSFRWLVVKGLLFVLLGFMAGLLLLLRTPQRTSLMLLICTVWAFCRAYYFCFYVLEKYVDATARFSGIGSAVKFIFRRWVTRV